MWQWQWQNFSKSKISTLKTITRVQGHRLSVKNNDIYTEPIYNCVVVVRLT